MADSKTLGRYEIIGELGRGGMGIVYKARDPRIDRLIALKTVKHEEFGDPGREKELLERFYIEARAAGKLTHANIVTIYDVGEEGDLSYIAMEFVEGRDIADILHADRVLPYEQAVNFVRQIAEGLSFAHEMEIVHRDIKPGNILVQKSGMVKITDFGLARLQSAGSVTQTGHTVGSPLYMSPEQVQGDHIDGRSDIFSLGVMFYEMVTGIRPFDGDSLSSIVFKIVQNNPQAPTVNMPDLPAGIDTVIGKMMMKDPKERYQNCQEIVKDLETIKSIPAPSGFDTTQASMTVDIHARKFDKPEPKSSPMKWVAAGIAAAIIAGAAWFFTAGQEKQTTARKFAEPPAASQPAPSTPVPEPQPAEQTALTPAPEPELIPEPMAPSTPAAPEPAPAIFSAVSVTSEVQGTVTVDGQPYGSTPIEKMEVEEGEHTIEITAPYHKTWSKTFAARDGQPVVIDANPQLAGDVLRVESEPPGANVLIDGKQMGQTPMLADGLTIGAHEVAVKLEGHADFKKTVNVSGADAVRVFANLDVMGGTLVVKAVKGSIIYIDGEKAGTGQLSKKLAPGEYKVRVSKSGFRSWHKTVKVEQGKEASFAPKLAKLGFGSIQASAIPWADIYINGVKKGATPRTIAKVTEGKVTVKLVNPGFKPFIKIINLNKGETASVSHTFGQSEARAQAGAAEEPEATGSLKVTSRPEGTVYVDGKLYGKTPSFVTGLAVGPHDVILKRPGFKDYKRRVNIVDGIVTRLAIEK